LEEVKILFHQARESFYNAAGSSWSVCIKTDTVPEELLQEVSNTSRALTLLTQEN